ncbi:hypothetical protein [Curtobacterium sp. MCSS17_007]|uniref:hypothetical protein n=1 Tax=Curtobacterium sp. MCSS17_007 TaxID=2175646 RepID=UPI000DA8F5CB|nr:hypothetical protein [Curtobacterium sp. MCSS17_007]WIE75718.1 hypothetical protein DEJ22_000200 [Curtobacterium sp. MCSS17_007]
MSRRGLLFGTAGAAVALAVSGSLGTARPAAAATAAAAAAPSATSIAAASAFLAARMDQYGSGSTLRVPQSYTGGAEGASGFVSSFAYDDAIVIMAWVSAGDATSLGYATVLADSLLWAQANDPYRDGRTRASYQPDPFRTADGPYIGSPAANTGNQAWVGMALLRLYRATQQPRFLQGALRLAQWIQSVAWDGQRSPVGYTGGRDGGDAAITYKATEHNIDVGAFFTMLASMSGDPVWSSRARSAFSFVAAMRDGATGRLWTGTGADGVTTNRSPVPGDVQNWAYLATLDSQYSPAVTWVITTLAASDGGYSGSAYSTADVSKVWFEGTAHLALAVRARGATGDPARYTALVTSIEDAQARARNGDGRGIVSASSDGLVTGFGDTYNQTLHLGATAWYLLAARGTNPFRL